MDSSAIIGITPNTFCSEGEATDAATEGGGVDGGKGDGKTRGEKEKQPSKGKKRPWNAPAKYHLWGVLMYNTEQCTGLDLPVTNRRFSKSRDAETIVAKMPNRSAMVQEIVDKACYIPDVDEVRLPKDFQFDSAPDYYETLFHELSHSTGHEKRLNRATMQEVMSWGDHVYSIEELVAELSGSFLLQWCGLATEANEENSAAYLKYWLERLKETPSFLLVACSLANQASKYILGKKQRKGKSKAVHHDGEKAIERSVTMVGEFDELTGE